MTGNRLSRFHSGASGSRFGAKVVRVTRTDDPGTDQALALHPDPDD